MTEPVAIPYPASWLDLIVNAPLCAISKRWPRKIHAAPLEQVATRACEGKTITAPCGATRLRLLGTSTGVLLWPTRAAGGILPRCRPCWELTGRKRPRAPRSLFVRRP